MKAVLEQGIEYKHMGKHRELLDVRKYKREQRFPVTDDAAHVYFSLSILSDPITPSTAISTLNTAIDANTIPHPPLFRMKP